MPLDLKAKFEPLEPWFARNRRDCWLPVVADADDGDPTGSKFSGAVWITDSEQWPVCPRCSQPMVAFLQLNLATTPEPIRSILGDGLLQAFFCIDDDCLHGPEEGDPFTKTHLIRVVNPAYSPGSAQSMPGTADEPPVPPRSIQGWELADDYPSMSEAECDLGLVHQHTDVVECLDPPFSAPAKLEEYFTMPWARDGEKLGGWPGWVNISTDYPDCPKCWRRMDAMIFQFGHEGYIPIMFGDGGQGQIVCCPDHPEVLAYPWTCG